MDDPDQFSTYDAKARFSEVLRRVREGRTVTVTWHGEPVAEIRPLDPSGGIEARLDWMRSRGLLSVVGPGERRFHPVARRPGALRRFLEEREG
ncbi:MAG: type II toxin-antitoxin system prevent-host-death family antitoxin [Longimicrobiales bacterium]|nr:type II toxin-antitoxin system prevent-host-death family antitoxin [Longimicrobiales bacterium]